MIILQLAITGMVSKWEYGASSLSTLTLGILNIEHIFLLTISKVLFT